MGEKLIKPYFENENIHAIAIPLPDLSNLITSNLYAIGKGPITLIDTGLKSVGTLDFVCSRLAKFGFSLGDVNRIIITHGHMDHFGLAASIREAVGRPIDCFIHEEDKWQVSSNNFMQEMWTEEADRLMAMAGVPRQETEKVRNRFLSFKELGDPLDGVLGMNDGDEFLGEGYCLKIVHTPGHTPGSCCVFETQQRILFSGDHIIKHITPNPFVVIDRSRLQNQNYQSLKAYLESLEKVLKLEVRYVFPGHGSDIDDLPEIVSAFRKHHLDRIELIWHILNKGRKPLYEIAVEVFGIIPDGEAFLAISEIIVHLEMLIERRRAELVEQGPPAIFRAL